MSTLAWLLMALAIALEVVGQLAFKIGLAQLEQGASAETSPAAAPPYATFGSAAFWRRLLLQRWIVLGVLLHTIEFGVWLAVLTLAPLSLAFPLMALSYCGVVAASHFWLHERVGKRTVFAMFLITFGVALLSLAPALV
jgi:drug/metabolite transporter (DMT)-like permease